MIRLFAFVTFTYLFMVTVGWWGAQPERDPRGFPKGKFKLECRDCEESEFPEGEEESEKGKWGS
jgi:hypothetical protein